MQSHSLVEPGNLFPQLSSDDEHGPNDRSNIFSICNQHLHTSVKANGAQSTRHQSKGLENASDQERQACRHPDKSRSCPEQRTGPVSIECFDMDCPILAGSYDQKQTFGIVLVRLVSLHLKSGTRMPCLEAFDIGPAPTQFIHTPRSHWLCLELDPRIRTRVAAYRFVNLLWL
jgi:hypothetical protein